MLVGLGNANFIMSHKFTEKKQNNCETKEVDDRCAHGVWCMGCCGKNTKGGSSGGCEGREQSWGKAESPLGFVLPGTQQTQNPSGLVGGLLLGACDQVPGMETVCGESAGRSVRCH